MTVLHSLANQRSISQKLMPFDLSLLVLLTYPISRPIANAGAPQHVDSIHGYAVGNAGPPFEML